MTKDACLKRPDVLVQILLAVTEADHEDSKLGESIEREKLFSKILLDRFLAIENLPALKIVFYDEKL